MKSNHQPPGEPRPGDSFYGSTQEKIQTLDEIASAIKAKDRLTKHGVILLILRELAGVNKRET